MDEDVIEGATAPNPGGGRRWWIGSAALIAAGAAATAVAVGSTSASAASTPSPSASGTATPGYAAAPGAAPGYAAAPGATSQNPSAHPNDCAGTAVTAAQEATLRAAALKAVPGGTVDRVHGERDGGFAVEVTKADKTRVIVRFDKNFKLLEVATGRGPGDWAHGDGHRFGGDFGDHGPRGTEGGSTPTPAA